jgi:starvation-inducible outer membrane lipoprotein
MFGVKEYTKQNTSTKQVVLALPAACLMLASCLIYPSIMKMETPCPSKTSIDFQWITQHYTLKNRTNPITFSFTD